MAFDEANQEHLKANRKKPKQIKQQLLSALNEAADKGPTKLRRVVDAIIEKAMTGDVAAFNAIAERIDGKVPQAVESEVREFVRIERIERVLIPAKKQDVIEHDAAEHPTH